MNFKSQNEQAKTGGRPAEPAPAIGLMRLKLSAVLFASLGGWLLALVYYTQLDSTRSTAGQQILRQAASRIADQQILRQAASNVGAAVRGADQGYNGPAVPTLPSHNRNLDGGSDGTVLNEAPLFREGVGKLQRFQAAAGFSGTLGRKPHSSPRPEDLFSEVWCAAATPDTSKWSDSVCMIACAGVFPLRCLHGHCRPQLGCSGTGGTMSNREKVLIIQGADDVGVAQARGKHSHDAAKEVCRHPVPREGKCLVYSFGVDGDFTFENELLNEFGKHSGILSRMGALICITDRITDLYH